MNGKRTYCILGTMLLAIASLGAGVSAEQGNERLCDLEELGILEINMDDGVIDAVITTEAFLSFMDSDDATLLIIESIGMDVGLTDDGDLELSEIEIGVGEEQSDEIAVILRLSDELVELLHEEDLDSGDLLRELGFGDDLGLDDFNPEVADDYWHSRIYWADEAFQVRGSQDDYDAVMDAEDPEDEFYRVLEEFEENYDELIEETFGARLHWADEAYHIRGSQDDYNRVMEAEDPADEFYNIYEELMQEWEEEEEVQWVDEEDDSADTDMEELLGNQCECGTLEGTFSIDEDGNGTMIGLVYNDDGEVIANMTGEFDSDGFVHGLAGADNITDVQWKAVYDDGHFTGLWKMINESDDTRGVLKGYYEANETGESGVFHGKWKVKDCEHMKDRNGGPDMDEIRPRHTPLKVDSDRVDTRPMDISPKQKPLMEKLGDVMDEPLIEDENGAIVDIGDAAAGSTLGTIALLGAGFIRRRITGGL